MMDFEQRRAEVLRRGQARIKARKRRYKIILGCVPVLLCVGLLLWTGLMPGGQEAENMQEEIQPVPESGAAPTWAALVEITVSSDGNTVRYTDPEKLDALYFLLESITAGSVEDPVVEDGEDNLTQDFQQFDCYSIRLTDEQGTAREFELWDGVLIARNTGKCYSLSKAQLDALLAALSVTE